MTVLNTDDILRPEDIIRLGPEVMEQLRSLFPFEQVLCWVPQSQDDIFPPVEISKRQKERAGKAISEGRPFWDLVASSVIIPVVCSAASEHARNTIDGAFVLSGVERRVGPEEPVRLLPLLHSWIETALSALKLELLRISPGIDIPPYIVRAAVALPEEEDGLNILHVQGRGGLFTHHDKLYSLLGKFLLRTSKGRRDTDIELCGCGPCDLWMIVHGFEEPELSASLRQIFHFPPLKISGIRKAFVHTFSAVRSQNVAEAETEMSGQIKSLEETARFLGLPLFSNLLLDDIETRFNCSGLKRLLPPAVAELKGSQFAAAFSAGRPFMKTRPDSGAECFDHAYHSSAGNCALLIKKVPRRQRPGFDLKGWGKKIQKLPALADSPETVSPVGVAASWQQTLKSNTAPGAAFWAYVHAFLLGTGKSVVADAVTWQVRGDELISAGAIQDACRAFRQALRLDDSSAEIWNSLGVSLAQIGRKKEAEKAFIAASEKNPRDFMAFYNLCGIRHARRKYREAEASCRRALDLRPADPMALMRLGQVMLDSGRYGKAAEYLKNAVSLSDTASPAAWRLLGTALYRQGFWPEAKNAFKKALKLRSDDAIALASLALGYAEHENDYATARRLVQGISSKSTVSPELGRISACISAIFEESSLDKEKGGG